INAAGQVYQQTDSFVYLGGSNTERGDLSVEIKKRVQGAWSSYHRYKVQLYNRPNTAVHLKVRMIKAEAVEALLNGCVTWTPLNRRYNLLRTAHHWLLRRCLGWHKRNRTDHVLSYREIPARTGCESIEATVRKRRLNFAGFVTRVPPGRIPKHTMFGEIVAVKGQEGEFDGRHEDWIRCLAGDMKAFGIEWQGWTTRALNSVEWHSCVEQGAERFMADW
ncbi:unnamed protein product, partial [Sphacelaria rigidula]